MGGMIGARYAQRYGDELAAVVLSGPVIGRWDAVEALLGADEIPDVPIDPTSCPRRAVGRAYVDDELVWHGPFKRPTLEALHREIGVIRDAGRVDSVPVLWLHGEDDQLVPIGPSREGFAVLAGDGAEQKSYPAPGTRSSTRPTRTRSSATRWSSSHGTCRRPAEPDRAMGRQAGRTRVVIE